MKKRKHSGLRRTSGERPSFGESFDDELTAEDLFHPSRRQKPDRKVLQLCRQVERSIGAVLRGGCADPVLQDLAVESVRPAPDAGRLLVTVYACDPAAAVP